MAGRVTIQDIAAALGLSRNTVSKVINHAEGISEATRRRVLEKAVELGYKEFSYLQLPQELIGRRPGAERESAASPGEIALLTTSALGGTHFAHTMLDHLQQRLMPLGYTLNTYLVSEENRRKKTLPVAFDPEQVSAILCIEIFQMDYGQMLCALGRPILFLDGPARMLGEPLKADVLMMDNSTELSRLIRKLLLEGKRSFGFIGDYLHCRSFSERYAALRYALQIAGVPVEERFIIKENELSGINAALSGLDRLPEFFLCANDYIAANVMQVLRTLRKSVPEDVMLCGFDDAPLSRVVVPPLTSVHIHRRIMAQEATYLLISRIEEPSLHFRQVYTETSLICRKSTDYLPTGEQRDEIFVV